MSDLTGAAVGVALRPLQTMPNAPDFDPGDYEAWAVALADENVIEAELHRALLAVLKTERYFPTVAVILEAVMKQRVADAETRRQQETRDRIRERRESFESLPPPETVDGEEFAPMDGLPVPPAREPLSPGEMQRRNMFGPVRLPDGRLDPRWPEVEGREEAWKRKMRFDHGLFHEDDKRAYELATSPRVKDRPIADSVRFRN